MDSLTLLFAWLGGIANGTFPVFIKTDAVLCARVHPTVFQLAKSVWVCIFGLVLLGGVGMASCGRGGHCAGRYHEHEDEHEHEDGMNIIVR